MKPTAEDAAALRAIRDHHPVTADMRDRLERLGLIHVEATLTRAGLAALDKAAASAIVAEVIGGTSTAFAKRVLAAARSVPKPSRGRSGWWGDQKVFIDHAYRAYAKIYSGMSLDEFKAAIIREQRDGHMRMSRADFVAAMDPRDVAESNTRSRGAVYNFIYVDG